ncbi:outer dense fiber protein 2-like isoform X1 [Cyprinodon tularosa]|uniref:outer dense fiber protein 2-like isoform X1 n=1 Tax=Cyprinodon tularosa TaxID=77115 RepID=UPI0018E236A0|nr:outer dense fiber protein 2-like isoform X1 [Cyprinodon tularosa]XP_038157459.1 outer dense fiber protein 2-like isoform X1 [Cyprinodon tularosa]
MSPEGKTQSPPLGFSPTGEDFPLSRGELESSVVPKDKLAHSVWARAGSGHEYVSNGKRPFLTVLVDAEAAASAAAIQLVAFKDAMEDEFVGSGRSTKDKSQIVRQKGLLLEKLEEFKRLNKSVRQKLKQLQDAEIYRIDADRKMDTLLKRIRKAESENEHLKKDLNETELRIEKMMDMRKEEQANVKSVVHITKSAETTRAHLQGQLRNKEVENNRLTVQLRSLERTVIEQKLEIEQLKVSFASLTKKAAQDKECLKKATRAQKLRAERFEIAIEKCYAQLKEKDAELAKARSEKDSRRQQKEQMTDEKEKLVAHINLLKSQFADLKLRLQKQKDELSAANERMAERLEKLIAENGDLTISNATLKASVARLEEQLADCESALIEEKTTSLERKREAEQCQYEVAELRAEIETIRMKHSDLLRETEKRRGGKGTEVQMVRQELQGHVEELKVYPQLLSEAEQSLFQCQENLQSLERKCSEKSESVKHLQLKMESQAKQLSSSVEMRESVREANLKVQEKVNSLQRKMDLLQQENLELVRKLASQEEALNYSNRQLDQRSSECQALNWQLEAALSDVREQVIKVKSQASSREETLQTKILELQAEKSRMDNELRLLRQSKQTAKKQFEVRLKDLQLSLDQSESNNRSIQNYVDFLKNSYKTMFDDGLQTSALGSSYFFR